MKTNQQQTEPDILKQLADVFGTKVKNRRLEIPETFGQGYCKGIVFNEHIRLFIMNYKLYKKVVLKNPDSHGSRKMILFKFQNIFPKTEIRSTRKSVKAIPSVLMTTSSINTEAVTIHTNMATINIEVDSTYLNGLFDLSEKSTVLQSLLQNTQPLLFEQMIYPSLQTIVDEIVTQSVGETFELFFLRVKAEELICRLLMELEKRDEKQVYDLNSRDIQTLYKVKERMLKHLDTPPVIQELSVFAGMSPTKLKRVFKQIFGSSIFHYYQTFRMKEAAGLLKEKKQSVSEVGYRMGFTNLSHFSRAFEEHIGMKPKQYSRS